MNTTLPSALTIYLPVTPKRSGKLDVMTVDRKLRVGVLLPSKKWTKHAFAHSLRIDFLHLQPTDVRATYLTSLRLDCLLHKVGDLLLEPTQLTRIHEEVARWGGPVVDNFEQVQVLSDRRLICSLLLHLEEHQRSEQPRPISKGEDDIIRLPPTVGTSVNQILPWCSEWERDRNGGGLEGGSELLATSTSLTSPAKGSLPSSSFSSSSFSSSIDDNWMRRPTMLRPLVTPTSMGFPIIRKPVAACSVEDSHLMCILYSPNQIMMDSDNECILQEFIPHRGVLYKIYVIGQEQRIQVRPSLPTPWLEPAPQARPFDSQSLKRLGAVVNTSEAMRRLTPDHLEQISQYTALLRKHLGLTLFGWDLIMEEGSDRLFIIDVNYFPGYDEVDFMNLLTEHLEQRLTPMATTISTQQGNGKDCLVFPPPRSSSSYSSSSPSFSPSPP